MLSLMLFSVTAAVACAQANITAILKSAVYVLLYNISQHPETPLNYVVQLYQ